MARVSGSGGAPEWSHRRLPEVMDRSSEGLRSVGMPHMRRSPVSEEALEAANCVARTFAI